MTNLDHDIKIYKDEKITTKNKKVIESICNIIKAFTGLYPYKEQIQAAKEIYKGNVVDMKTGEGKSLTILVAILMVHREGRKIYVSTSNDYLSKRDYEYSKPLLEALEVKSVFLAESVGGEDPAYKNNDVIYATGETLIFDYLRGVRADYDFVIIDEIDYILVESANHDFSVTSESELKTILPINVFKACAKIAEKLSVVVVDETIVREDIMFDYQAKHDVILYKVQKNIEITTRGYIKIAILLGKNYEDPVWREILLATLHAKYHFIRNEQYIIENGKIIIISDANGRKMPNGSNDICIQTAMELKENLPITAKSILTNTCSFPVFFSIFKTLTGISGTTSFVPFDFDVIYKKQVKVIKEHFPNQRKEIFEYYKTEIEKRQRIYELVHIIENPILLVTDSDKESQAMKYLLTGGKNNKNIYVLDNITLEEEKKLLETVKYKNAVLISSKIVGRGTDITVNDDIKGGLVVILTKRLLSERSERQIIGRTGRNGKEGTCYIMASSEDPIFAMEYKRKVPTEKYIKKLQKRYERHSFEQRKHIYIRSKLFFDQDKAIKDTLENFISIEHLRLYVYESPITKARQNTIRIIEKMPELNFSFHKMHKTLLVHLYMKHRPYFQNQFITYNDAMSTTLYNTDLFSDRCHEYVSTGRDIILEVIGDFFKTVGKENDEHRRTQEL